MLNYKNRLGITTAVLTAVIAFTSCASAQETNETSVSEVSTSTIETTEESTEITTTETESTALSFETERHDNPLGGGSGLYDAMAFNLMINDVSFLPDAMYGFDNPRTLYLLQQEVYNRTGVMDTTITISDVDYFQNTQFLQEMNEGGDKFSENSDLQEWFVLEGARAVLSSLGLRFGIDEIPASYLMQRFPRLYYDVFVYNQYRKFADTTDIDTTDITTINSLAEITDQNQLDCWIFRSCFIYNFIRFDCVWSNPYGGHYITQARNPETGRNVLIPTEREAVAMQEDVNTIPGCENLSIYVPETAEEFYDSYGYYPDDLLQNRGSVNTPEAFEEYINSLPASEKNDVYITAINNCLANPT